MAVTETLAHRSFVFLIVFFVWFSSDSLLQPAQGQSANAPTVLITGANRGIGFEFVQAYTEKGWNVIATCRTPSKADALNALAAENAALVVEELDVTDFDEIDALAEKYKDQPIDVLLNNAGILPSMDPVRFGNIDYKLLDDMLKVNSIGPLKVSDAFLENVVASDQKKIVTMTTIGGSIGSVTGPGGYQYRGSKAALNMILRVMSFELADRGVIVGLIHPGFVDTTGFLDADPETLPERVREALPILLRPRESVDLMVSMIEGLTPEKSGVFYEVTGEILPW